MNDFVDGTIKPTTLTERRWWADTLATALYRGTYTHLGVHPYRDHNPHLQVVGHGPLRDRPMVIEVVAHQNPRIGVHVPVQILLGLGRYKARLAGLELVQREAWAEWLDLMAVVDPGGWWHPPFSLFIRNGSNIQPYREPGISWLPAAQSAALELLAAATLTKSRGTMAPEPIRAP